MCLRAFVCLLFALLALVQPVWAATTGALEVVVTDRDDLEVPNAEVSLGGLHMVGGTQVRTTDASGRARFANLVPATDYEVVVKAPVGEVGSPPVTVQAGRITVLELELGKVTEITVERPKTVDLRDTSDSRILDRKMLDLAPTGRTTEGGTALLGGAQGVTRGANANFGGAASDENSYTIDGVQITDPVTGTFSANFNYEAIEQLELLLGGYMPEHGVSLGAVVNIVTASGSNELQFSSSVFYTNGDWRPRLDERLAADGAVLSPSGFDNSFSTLQLSAMVSGPIVRDKAFFVLSYQHSRSLIGVSGTPQRRDFDGHYVLGKLTIQPALQHRFTAFVQMDPTTIDNTYQGDPFIKAAAQGRQSQGGLVGSARWLWALGDDIDLDTAITAQRSFIERGGVPCTHDRNSDKNKCRPDEAQDTVDWYSPGRDGIGGAYDTVNNVLFDFDDRSRLNIGTKLSMRAVEDPMGGLHDLKAGVEVQQLFWDKTFGVNGNLLQVDTNAVPFDPESFTNLYWIEYSRPLTFQTTGTQTSAFVQDSWKVFDNLTVNFGTRFDRAVLRNDSDEAVLDAALWGPRLYAAWDPFRDQKTKIAGGFGRFNDTGRLSVADFTSRSGFGSKLYLGEQFGDGTGVGFLNGQSQSFDYQPNRTTNTAHDRLKNPHTDEVVLILEREIAKATVLSSRTSARLTRNLYEYDEQSVVYDEQGTTNIGSRYGDPDTSYYRVRTPALARRTVYTWDLEARRVFHRRMAATLAYTFTQALGSSASSLSGSFANDPQTAFNYGPIPNAQQHTVRAVGLWEIPLDPWTPQIGAFLVAGSGIPVERYYWENTGQGSYGARIAPRNAYTRLDPFWDLSVRYQQTIPTRTGSLRLSFEAQNLTNNRAGGRISSTQLTGGRFLDETGRAIRVERQDPLRLQLGVRYDL
ncbi:MAG: TonB-dependent receptor [Alphaproteobacteria bacterium]|nr:TonB-dependent receptor [Alphaproteobacteria bacterium]